MAGAGQPTNHHKGGASRTVTNTSAMKECRKLLWQKKRRIYSETLPSWWPIQDLG